MTFIKMREFIYLLSIVIISLIFISCGKEKQEKQEEEQNNYIIVNSEDDIGKYGKGTYINTNSYQKCERCGRMVHRDNIFHGPNGSCGREQSYSSDNQYDEGYEQGQEDASNGLESDPSGYGGNGQFEKGYEDGYDAY